MSEQIRLRIALESGATFEGWQFGAKVGGLTFGEAVFNTCMTGYQEVVTDPSYAGQFVVMTYPLIGNYGVFEAHSESSRAWCNALIVRELSPDSGPDFKSLSTLLEENGVPGIRGVDTRALVQHLRSRGSMRALIAPADLMGADEQIRLAQTSPSTYELDLVGKVCLTTEPTQFTERLDPMFERELVREGNLNRWKGSRIVAVDFGVKRNQLRALVSRGAEVLVVPHDSTVDAVMALKPDGVLLSNGPGDPARLPRAVALTKALLEQRVPMLGICLGHQILGRAIGASTSKLKFGHHGGNHPVKDTMTGAVAITSQNHEFQVDADSIPRDSGWFVSELNLNDGSVEGLRHAELPVFSVQYHPEGAPGPQDRSEVFDEFMEMVSAGTSGASPLRGIVIRDIDSKSPYLAQSEHPSGGGTGYRERPLKGLAPLGPMEPSDQPRSVLVIGSGPIVIGQAAEFDYAGTQACKALREEGVKVILVNSNPATIMTDEETADTTYIEPLTVEVITQIIERERPDGLLAGLGGQTALNLAVALDDAGVLAQYGVKLLGTPLTAIRTAEDRAKFAALMKEIGEPTPTSAIANNLDEATAFEAGCGLPLIVRPAFTLGGTGGGLCDDIETFNHTVKSGLAASPISQVLIERSVAGWREVEYEVMRDAAGTTVVVCAMENLDPMGVHTGDSVVVAPTQTLTDREYQMLRSSAIRIISALNIQGGCNVQFALPPRGVEAEADAPYYVIEVNPRVSRSSALASKATGYPIARVAAKVAIGKRLDEIQNTITNKTTAAFEPSIDYCAVKIPRWPFDKFPDGQRQLGTQMKSTGEVMALERSFPAAFNKAVRSLELKLPARGSLTTRSLCETANDLRMFALMDALRMEQPVDQVANLSRIDPWFIAQLQMIIDCEKEIATQELTPQLLATAKRLAISDQAIEGIRGVGNSEILELRRTWSITPVYKCVDTCAAEFEAYTQYFYSTYGEKSDADPAGEAVVILGSGPLRIGQGIEFDYCCVHAAASWRKAGVDAVMINSNPETVSTDFDCSSRLYFEPLDLESVGSVIDFEKARGVVVQFGGQTALNLAKPLHERGVEIIGTSFDAIETGEDRKRTDALLEGLGIDRPAGGTAATPEEALAVAERIGYPVLVRPSFVLGGRAMEIAHHPDSLRAFLGAAFAALPEGRGHVLVDKYLVGIELDVDCISDGTDVVIPGILEHIEMAGVHSGDSAAVIPPQRLSQELQQQVADIASRVAIALDVRGLCNVQFAIADGKPYVLEVNPRASRTVPFISKVTGIPMVALACQITQGKTLHNLGYITGLQPEPAVIAVKAPVFSIGKLSGVDTALGPEMKSTGEVMGANGTLASAVRKAFEAALGTIPSQGSVLCSVADRDKALAVPILGKLASLDFALYATDGTAALLEGAGISVKRVAKIGYGRPDVVDVIEDGSVNMVVNTISYLGTDEMWFDTTQSRTSMVAEKSVKDGYRIRRAADERRIPCVTSLDTLAALVESIENRKKFAVLNVSSLKEWRQKKVGTANET